MQVEALLFDVGGTAFDWRTAVSKALNSVESKQLRSIDTKLFGDQWREQSMVEVDEIAERSKPRRPFDDVLRTSLDRTLCEHQIANLPETDVTMLMNAWEQMPTWPEIPSALRRLRKRFFVAPHTVLSLRVAAFSSKNGGLDWDAIISCDALSATKLDPESYAQALTAIGRSAEQVLFVASHPTDLRAARGVGMKTAYVVARLEDPGDDYEDTGFSNEFDVVANNFEDLADQIGA